MAQGVKDQPTRGGAAAWCKRGDDLSVGSREVQTLKTGTGEIDQHMLVHKIKVIFLLT